MVHGDGHMRSHSSVIVCQVNLLDQRVSRHYQASDGDVTNPKCIIDNGVCHKDCGNVASETKLFLYPFPNLERI
jgi:hypothetical protein